MVRTDEINLGEDCGPMEGGGEVLNVWDWVAIRDSATIESSIIATRSPITRSLLRDHLKWRGPVGIGEQSSVQACITRTPHTEFCELVCGEGVCTAANACYHDRLTSETTETDWHVRLPRRGKPVQHVCLPDRHPRLHRRRGIEARLHSEEMHDRLDDI